MILRSWRYIILILSVSLALVVGTVHYVVNTATSRQIYNDINQIPKNRVGLLLGTAKYNDKSKNIINVYYQHRIDAAVALYMAGKVDFIIVSGDNSTLYYNEPLLMKNDLIARGVPA